MSVEMVFTEAAATNAARRNADAFGTAIQRWNDQLGVKQQVQMYISPTRAETMIEPEIETAAALVAVSTLLATLTEEYEPALKRIDGVSRAIVGAFLRS